VKKSEKPRFNRQNKLLSENTKKMSLIPIFNKTSPRAHMESELDVLGVHEKLVKYVVHLSKRKN
jgi:hypothetical protein